MSLVAYCASDDSEQSDSESQEEKKNILRDDPISDEDDGIQTTSAASSITVTSSSVPLFSKSLLDTGITEQALPPPHKTENLIIEESELEEEVRQKPSELADAPKPPPKRTKQPVKITIPSLNDIADESDEEEGESKQKPVASTVRSGLFSLLPAPIHSARKEINRPLMPHSLGKKAPSAKPANVHTKPSQSSTSSNGANNSTTKNTNSAVSVNKSRTVQSALTGYGSDSSDDEGDDTGVSQNFFSLGQKPLSAGSENTIVEKTSTATVEVSNDVRNSETKLTASPPQEDEVVVQPEPGLTNDLPLSFSNPSSSWSASSSNHQPYTSNIGHVSSVQYNMVDTDEAEINQLNEAEDDLQKVMGDKEFQRMNGKRKRGMEEAISFVDAKVDDYVDPSELSKYVTEETEYTSVKNKDDMPTSQQKRKKQITYLAFQAKEKELELKNTWANNRLTKRQTQAKYGF